MAEQPSPGLIKFIRRAIRRQPDLSYEEVVQRWQSQHGELSEEQRQSVQAIYDEERARPSQAPREQDPRHSRRVVTSIAAWIVLHLIVLLGFGVPVYTRCLGETTTATVSSGCGVNLGLVALLIGWVQLFYGVIGGLIVAHWRTAIGQGIMIGSAAVTLLFTVLCFGAALGSS
jgi:hypothetical protein